MGKKCGKFKFFSKSLDKISIYLDKISIYLDKILITYKYLEKSRFVSICLERLDLSQQSRQKSRHSQVSIKKSRF